MRLGFNMSHREMAELVGLEVPQVEALEAGAVEASTDQLDRYARVFGLSLRRFLAGGAETAPPALLFRSLRSEKPSFEDLLETGASSLLGEFVRCAADVAELKTTLGEAEARLPRELDGLATEVAQDIPHLYRQAERLALDVRSRLGLGLDPIPSMIELVQDRLGIAVFWVGPDDLDPNIDGASAYAPNPAILVNLVGGAECWWRTRTTLAHELCHLLFDLSKPGPNPGTGRALLFSPHRERMMGTNLRGFRLPRDLDLLEQRANAFAAYFLAPAEAVKTTLGSLSPTSDIAINTLCQRFDIGRLTAINHITNVFKLSKQDRLSMVARPPSDLLLQKHPDAEVRPGLRAGRLRDLVARALTEGRLGKGRARQLLGLSSSEPLPEFGGLSEEQRAPVHTPEHQAWLSAQRYLTEHAALNGYYVSRVSREGEQFRIEVAYADETTWSAPLSRGYLIISSGFVVLDRESHLEISPRAV